MHFHPVFWKWPTLVISPVVGAAERRKDKSWEREHTIRKRQGKKGIKKKISIFVFSVFSQLSKYCEQRPLCGLICCTKPAEITKDGLLKKVFTALPFICSFGGFSSPLNISFFVVCSLTLRLFGAKKRRVSSTQKAEKEGKVWVSGRKEEKGNLSTAQSGSDLLTPSSADVMRFSLIN